MWLLSTLLNCLSSETNENELFTVYSLVENGATKFTRYLDNLIKTWIIISGNVSFLINNYHTSSLVRSTHNNFIILSKVLNSFISSPLKTAEKIL